jgi:uncharacterized protein with HEPN domain
MLSLERLLEVVGEAARHVSDQQRAAAAAVPWERIIGQRNVLAHMYGEIRHERLYKTAREDVPDLIAALRRLLA